MEYRELPMAPRKRIALVAHDNKKQDLLEWATFNRVSLADHLLYATGTTGSMLEELGLDVIKLESGPLGGDQQIGALISQGEINFVIVWNIPMACDRASADFMISSPLMQSEYVRIVPDYATYRNRLAAAQP
jgi:methylglyoxal synthase